MAGFLLSPPQTAPRGPGALPGPSEDEALPATHTACHSLFLEPLLQYFPDGGCRAGISVGRALREPSRRQGPPPGPHGHEDLILFYQPREGSPHPLSARGSDQKPHSKPLPQARLSPRGWKAPSSGTSCGTLSGLSSVPVDTALSLRLP